MHTFQTLHEIVVSRLEKEAEKIGGTSPRNLYRPIEYTLKMGGKRLRPIMLLMACDLWGADIEDAMNAALAIEIFHNFTLLHDDIMDHADLRRNKQSVHKKYNENVAILSGDAMSIMAYQYLLKIESPAFKDMVLLFSKTALEVCEGQQYDMDFEGRTDVSIDDYLKMIRLKTAVLIACSLQIGALAGGASAIDAEHIYKFGINLGMAFQLQDDLLDVFADQKKFGKRIGGDIVANKKTFLFIKSLELANSSLKGELTSLFSNQHIDQGDKIERVKNIYELVGIKRVTEELIDDYFKNAVSELESVEVENYRKENLYQLAKILMNREH